MPKLSFKSPLFGTMALIAFVMVSCSPEGSGTQRKSGTQKPGRYVADVSKSIESMKPSDVIFEVNGQKICKSDFSKAQRFYETVFRIVRGVRPGKEQEAAEDYAWRNEQRVLPMLMQRAVFGQTAKERGVSVTPDEVELCAKPYLAKWNMDDVTLSGLKKKLGEEEGTRVIEYFTAEALNDKVVRALARDGWYHVSDEEVTNELARVRTFNETANRMNARARETLLKAKKEILDGGIFSQVTKKYGEYCPEQGKEWITVQLEELNAEGEKGLREWLKNAEMGDISDPIDFDDGVSIVGVVRKGEGEAPEGVVGPTLYTLVRCTMLARNNMEVPTADEVRKAVLEFKRGEARREVFTNLYHAATIEFPNGTNFFPNAGRRAAGK